MIIAVVNLKGGVAKTTTAIALATAIERQGHSVRVLDADPQGSATLWADGAEDNGEPLPFEVQAANAGTIARAAKKLGDDEWIVIDCPPSGKVADAAVTVCDFAVVPTTPSAIDLQQSYATAATLEANDKRYALLLTRADKRTLSFRATQQAIAENAVSCFDNCIPQREEIKGMFGHSFGDKMHGYKKVLAELEEAMGQCR